METTDVKIMLFRRLLPRARARVILSQALALPILISSVFAGADAAGKDIPLGFMLDVSRDKVPTTETLQLIVDTISSLGYRELQLYTEHAFAYTNHCEVWRDASPLTAAEVRSLDAYAASRGVALVANQNSFGHLSRWLALDRYKDLAEAPRGGARTKWGTTTRGPDAISPADPRSLQLVESWYDELLPCFKSRLINIGCDEVFDLNSPTAKSAAEVARVGEAQVYLGFLTKLAGAAKSRGATPMLWADFFLDHPDRIGWFSDEGAIALDWGYDSGRDFSPMAEKYAAAGVRFRICPGTSTWNSLSGRLSNMQANLRNAASAARKHGADALLLTAWGDGGHPQPFVANLPALADLAMLSRGRDLPREKLAKALDGIMATKGAGALLLDYGDIHLKCGKVDGNSTPLFDILRRGRKSGQFARIGEHGVRATLDEWKRLKARNSSGECWTAATPDWVKDGFAVMDLLYAALEMRLNGDDGAIAREIVPEYRRLWLKYNRPGGLNDSVRSLFSASAPPRGKRAKAAKGKSKAKRR